MKSFKMLMMAALTILTISVFAQNNEASNKTKAPKPHAQKMKYSCPMHPDITSYKSGKCSKCGMELVHSKKVHMKMSVTNTYTCPMHPDVVLNKPGVCTKCGTALKPTSKEQMKMKVMKLFTCPMHADETADKAGKCPKCGMEMQAKN